MIIHVIGVQKEEEKFVFSIDVYPLSGRVDAFDVDAQEHFSPYTTFRLDKRLRSPLG